MTSQTDRLSTALAGRYAIERELGQGGMATVYLAEDLKHDRKVAIKVLRPELAAVIGAQRFLAEIKTTANLQHPHILPLHDSGEVDGRVFYVMPFVEGESLRDRLAREKQLPVEEAVDTAREVADALDYAHRHGVVHRDIKPENILLQGGHALVADFGIALAAVKTGGSRMTETGMSLGTPTYMSPEQAMGERELDGRADEYALGCVLYEMLVGEPPFTGPTAQAVVARVLTEPAPAARAKRPTLPEPVDDAIRRALQKLPADRFRTAAEFGAALAAPHGVGRSAVAAASKGRSSALVVAAGALVLLAIVAASFLTGRSLGARHAAPIGFGRTLHVTWDPGLEITPALSPDGRTVAYAAGPLLGLHVMVRPVGEGRAVPLTGDTAAAETEPDWSPDGSRILFLARGGVFSAPASGGPARPEVPGDSLTPVVSAAWGPEGDRIAFARDDSLFIREHDASVHALARLPQAARCRWSPNGGFIACAVGNPWYAAPGALFDNVSPSWVVLCRVRDGALTTVTDSLALNHSPVWSPDNRWLYVVSDRDGPSDIYALPVTGAGRAGGGAVRLSTGLGAHTISLAAAGSRLAFAKYSTRSSIWSIPIPANPPVSTAAATRITNANESISNMSLSPDGGWLLYDSNLPGNNDLFRLSLAGGQPAQLTTDPSDDFNPQESPDGKEVAFHSWRSGSRDVFVMRLDGGGIQQVTHTPRQESLAMWSPDGKALAFTDLAQEGIWIVRRDAAGNWGEPRLRRAGGVQPMWSPDGRSIAFSPSQTQGGIVIMPVDSGPERVLVRMDNPGLGVTWAKDGTIYYSAHDARGAASVWSVPGSGGPARLLLKFDAALHPSFRTQIAVGNGRICFTSEDHESDIWAMEVKRP